MASRRGGWGAAVAMVAALSAAGCVSIPSAGPVQSYPVTQGPDVQGAPYQQVVVGAPGPNWTPQQIVAGFLTASASFGDNWQVARQYMTPQASKAWSPSWSATVYSNGPNVEAPVYTVTKAPATATATQKASGSQPGKKSKPATTTQASVTITGSVLASLSGSTTSGYGSYAVPSSSVPSSSVPKGSLGTEPVITLVENPARQWRISSAPPKLLLTSDSFKSDYQLRNLYFFDPASRYLVPDPVYVPLQATPAGLMNGLVYDLVKPPKDWLSGGATRTALPSGTSISGVTLDGVTAVVDLGGALITHASRQEMQEISAQLVWTLSGSGQGGEEVQSVQVEVNGKPWIPPGNTQGNPVQRESNTKYSPAAGASGTFYYLAAENVMSSDGAHSPPVKIAHVGAGFAQAAVSPDGKWLALISSSGSLFTGSVDGPLTKRGGGDYTTMSWDPNDDLWATESSQIVMLRAAGQGQPIVATVVGSNGTGTVNALFTAVRVAPDGVRMALVEGGTEVNFGAISWQPGVNPDKLTARILIVLSPFDVPAGPGSTFSSLSWYGPDNVITLTTPGPAVTEYPVNGGAATSISAVPGMLSISAAGDALTAGLGKGRMAYDASLTGSWMTIGDGVSPVYPG